VRDWPLLQKPILPPAIALPNPRLTFGIVDGPRPFAAPTQYLVEFSDAEGREEAMATLNGQEFVELHYELAVA
jgi:hypothetical protein